MKYGECVKKQKKKLGFMFSLKEGGRLFKEGKGLRDSRKRFGVKKGGRPGKAGEGFRQGKHC